MHGQERRNSEERWAFLTHVRRRSASASALIMSRCNWRNCSSTSLTSAWTAAGSPPFSRNRSISHNFSSSIVKSIQSLPLSSGRCPAGDTVQALQECARINWPPKDDEAILRGNSTKRFVGRMQGKAENNPAFRDVLTNPDRSFDTGYPLHRYCGDDNGRF